MTQISVLAGIKTDANAALLDSVPINLEPTVIDSAISQGYLTSSPGISAFAEGSGRDRAAINWNGVCYRVQGSKLITISVLGTITVIGDVGDDGFEAFLSYGVDRLAIVSNELLYYYDGVTLSVVTDPLVIEVKYVQWVDGYYLLTDGVTIFNTTLADPYIVNPLSYGTAEIDPDGIYGLAKIRNEIHVMGRYTIELLQNVGGNNFPFARNLSGYVPKGTVGPKAFCEFNNILAFIGSGKDEALDVYLSESANAVSISTPLITDILQGLSDDEQFNIKLEKQVNDNEQRLFIHLNDKSLVYHLNASIASGKPVWTIRAGGTYATDEYPLHNLIFVYNKYIGANRTTGQVGYLDYSVSTHYGIIAGWEFQTVFVYNKGGFTVTDLELIAVTGRTPLGIDPTLFFSYSRDGITYSQERAIKQGQAGQFNKRLAWRPMCRADNFMNFKFRGANTSIASIIRLEAQIEGQLA